MQSCTWYVNVGHYNGLQLQLPYANRGHLCSWNHTGGLLIWSYKACDSSPQSNFVTSLLLCSVNDVEEKYYADGEDAYDMRKPFKDVKSKPAILPKGSSQQKPKQAKARRPEVVEPSVSQVSNDEDPSAAAQDEEAGSKSADTADKTAVAGTTESKSAQAKAKTSKSKKR